MHILCYGAGAVGSLIGGRLAESGAADVTLLARLSHVAAIRTRGLTLDTPAGVTVCKRVDSITSIEDLRTAPDMVMLAVKTYQTADALLDLAPLLRGAPCVLTLQNGIGNEDMIAAAAGADRTVSGAVTISTSVVQAGVVRQNTPGGGVALAALGRAAPPPDVVALFRRAGFRAAACPDYRAMKWSKLLLNILGNATCAILDLPPGEVVHDRRLWALEREAVREALRVISGLGLRLVSLPGYPVPLVARIMAAPAWVSRGIVGRRLSSGRGPKMPSLWEDLERGRDRSEVEVLNGAVAREGARLGVATPVNDLLAGVLLALVRGERDRGAFRRNPDALLSLLTPRPT